jgi:hypothetical protein
VRVGVVKRGSRNQRRLRQLRTANTQLVERRDGYDRNERVRFALLIIERRFTIETEVRRNEGR